MPVDKRRCMFDCDKVGRWRSGMCPTCQAYIRRAENRSVAWRVARMETVARWSERLMLTIPKNVHKLKKVSGG